MACMCVRLRLVRVRTSGRLRGFRRFRLQVIGVPGLEFLEPLQKLNSSRTVRVSPLVHAVQHLVHPCVTSHLPGVLQIKRNLASGPRRFNILEKVVVQDKPAILFLPGQILQLSNGVFDVALNSLLVTALAPHTRHK